MGWGAGGDVCQIAEWNATAGPSFLCHCLLYLLILYSITFIVFTFIKIVLYISTFLYEFTSKYIGLRMHSKIHVTCM
jgi:hypothetical protein